MAGTESWDVVVLHGVGAPSRGAVLEGALAGASPVAGQAFTREDLIVGGTPYPRAFSSDAGPVASITEVNWADLLKPIPGAIGTIRHLTLLGFALLDSAEHLLDGARPVQLLRRLYAAVFLWCIWPAIACLFVVVYRPAPALAATLAGSVALLVAFLSIYLARYSRAAVGGVGWAAISAAFAIGAWWDPQPFVRASAQIYALGQIVGVAALFVASTRATAAYARHRDFARWLGHLGTLYVPVVLASAVGAVLWSIVLWAVRTPRDGEFDQWGEWFSVGLRYDLRAVEFATAGATGAVGIAALGAAAVYAWNRWRERRGRVRKHRSGARAQQWMLHILWLAPAAFTAVATYFLYTYARGSGVELNGEEVLGVYRTSALRVVPFLLAALGPLSVVMDVLGDVAFYLARDPRLSISDEACDRLRQILTHLRGAKRPIVVVAHSQGTIIAARALSAAPLATLLITVGSPVDSLYQRFLGHPPGRWSVKVRAWHNLVRNGDYIGGPIEDAQNASAGNGGHTGYFEDARIWQAILQSIATPSRPESSA